MTNAVECEFVVATGTEYWGGGGAAILLPGAAPGVDGSGTPGVCFVGLPARCVEVAVVSLVAIVAVKDAFLHEEEGPEYVGTLESGVLEMVLLETETLLDVSAGM